MSTMRSLALVGLLLAATLLQPAAGAQTTINPIEGAYTEAYIVTGRILDSAGEPFSGGHVRVELQQSDVKAAPVTATVNCKGDFITSFNLRAPSYEGSVKITAYDGQTVLGTTTAPLDPFWRRTDASMKLGSVWGNVCTGNQDVWDVSATVTFRMLNRTDPYKIDEHEFQANAYRGFLRLRYEPPGAATVCPPKPNAPGVCEQFLPDERGDVRYTFTLDQPFEAGGRVHVLLQNHTDEGCDERLGTCYTIPIDPETRLGVRYFEMTGRGAPERKEAPLAAPLVVLAALALLALATRRRS